jgi:hypothetical protein
VVTGPIHERYLAMRKWKSGLGLPVTSNYRVPGGQRVRFRFGQITWDRSSDRVTVRRRG